MFRQLTFVFFVAIVGMVTGCSPHSSTPDVAPPTTADEVVLLPFPSSDGGSPTWDNWTGAFVRDYCVECHNPQAKCGGEGCHAAGDPVLFDFRDERAVITHREAIRCGVAATTDPSPECAGFTAKEFPKWAGSNPLPTDEQRALVVEWIDAGMP